jgi:hypothetical protein
MCLYNQKDACFDKLTRSIFIAITSVLKGETRMWHYNDNKDGLYGERTMAKKT